MEIPETSQEINLSVEQVHRWLGELVMALKLCEEQLRALAKENKQLKEQMEAVKGH